MFYKHFLRLSALDFYYLHENFHLNFYASSASSPVFLFLVFSQLSIVRKLRNFRVISLTSICSAKLQTFVCDDFCNRPLHHSTNSSKRYIHSVAVHSKFDAIVSSHAQKFRTQWSLFRCLRVDSRSLYTSIYSPIILSHIFQVGSTYKVFFFPY